MINILGSSGHAKVVTDVIRALRIADINYYDDQYTVDKKDLNGFNLSGAINDIPNQLSDKQFHIAIGINSVREAIASRMDALNYPVLIHPSAIISASAHVNEGSVCMAGTIVQAAAVVGKHCIINTGASIDHDCHLKDFVQVAPGAVICGNVVLGERSYVGAGAVIKQGISIGQDVMIGAGAVVVKDISSNCMVVGNPAKIIKQGKFV